MRSDYCIRVISMTVNRKQPQTPHLVTTEKSLSIHLIFCIWNQFGINDAMLVFIWLVEVSSEMLGELILNCLLPEFFEKIRRWEYNAQETKQLLKYYIYLLYLPFLFSSPLTSIDTVTKLQLLQNVLSFMKWIIFCIL